MAEAEGGGNIETQQISMQISSFPRDLLQTFIPSGSNFHGKFEVKEEKIEVVEEDKEEEIELSLGLSLNGRFGVDPCSKRLKRCSSIPEFMYPVKKEEDSSSSSAAAATAGCVVPTTMWTSMPLSRTCSLPVETEEVWRKRKELQTMRRMEAKRKRTEKQRNLRPVAKDHGPANLEENCEDDKRIEDKGSRTVNGNQQYMKVSPPPPRPPPTCVPNWVRGTGFGACGIESKGERSDGFVSGGGGMDGLLPQGMNKCTEARSPANTPTLPEESDQEPAVTPAATEEPENPSKNPTVNDKGAEEMVRNMMLGMPSVSTKGDGLNCKTIQGLLYPYKKGEEVKILCVCHGSFLSPAEFVKHAGGGEVANPLKHIVVNPSSFL